jgi:hypothetical protein
MEKRKRGQQELSGKKKKNKDDHLNERMVAKMRRKIDDRLRREYSDNWSFLAGESLMLGKIAYDLSRSGTEDQIDDIEKISSSIPRLLDLQQVIPLSKTSRIQQAHLYSESAFLLSLSGVKNRSVYDIITRNILLLLLNLQYAPSDDFKQIVDLLELLAISGIRTHRDNSEIGFAPFAQIVQTIIPLIDRRSNEVSSALKNFLLDIRSEGKRKSTTNNSFGYWLHSPAGGPLMALWTHSTKQKKVRCVFNEETVLPPGTRKAKLSQYSPRDDVRNGKKISKVIWGGDSPLGFADMSLPLVVDVGCGFGVSLLGLAALAESSSRSETENRGVIGNWNCLGCDLSSHCIRYAQSISARWNLSDRCRFCVAPAEDFVEWVRDFYPGPMVWLLLQFPTPYVLRGKTQDINRNIQLPVLSVDREDKEGTTSDESGEESGFMVTNKLIETLLSIAVTRNDSQPSPTRLYIQSNVEDVAVTMKNKVESQFSKGSVGGTFRHLQESHLESGSPKFSIQSVEPTTETKTKRQELWEELGGEQIEIGRGGWLRTSPFPVCCRTETEASYAIMNKPVFRIGWEVCSDA